MTKSFCDLCDNEITEKNATTGGHIVTSRAGVTLLEGPLNPGGLKVEVIATWKGTGNAGDFCKYCILDALAKLDDRPREESA